MNTVTRRPHDRSESGFTIIEVMVAIMVLLVGVLGTVTMIDTANGVTANTKSREGAFNLSREIIEAARRVDYDLLTPTGATPTLQSLTGLGDADTSTSGWQLVRRGVSYTETVTSCVYDDPKDGGRSAADGGAYCAGSASQVPTNTANGNCAAKNPNLPCIDTQPDDFRKLIVTSQWQIGSKVRNSTQTALLVNPTGGRGPRITTVTRNPTLASAP